MSTCRIAVSLGLGAAALAQAPLSGGPLLGSPTAFTLDGGSTAGPDATTLLHRSGFGLSPVPFPSPAVAPGSPNLQAILASSGAAGLDVDDFSSGRDDVLIDSDGFLEIPPTAWGVLHFSLRNGATGSPNSRVAQELVNGALGAACFSWVLPGSSLPPALVGRVDRAHGRAELGLTTAANPEVDGLDTPQVLGVDQTVLSNFEPGMIAYLPTPEAIYFTVAAGSLGAVPTSWWNWSGVATPPSGATILRVLKSSRQGAWSTPHVWMPFYALGLTQAIDIDALAVDANAGKVLFSAVGNQLPDQWMMVDLSSDGGPVPKVVKTQTGTPVSQAVGTAQNDDVDAVCTLDPRVRSNGWVPDDFGASCGSPRDAYQPHLYPVALEAAAFRRFSGGVRHYDTWMLGWPSGTPTAGVAVLGITLGDTLAPMVTASFQVRSPGSSLAGDPRSYTLDIPATYALVGFSVTFRWFGADASLVSLVQALPVKAFL